MGEGATAVNPEENPKRRPAEFLSNVQKDLNFAISNVDILIPDEDLRKLIVKVWKGMEPKFPTVKSHLQEKNLEYFQDRGLAEEELDLKLLYTRKKNSVSMNCLIGHVYLQNILVPQRNHHFSKTIY